MVSNNWRTSPKIPDLIRILLVDDTAIITDRLSKALDDIDGVSIVGVSQDSAQAIDDIACLRPNVIVLDIQLRDSNGWDVLKSVTHTNPETLVFIFSNDSAPATREQFIAGGADQFFDKSREFAALYQTVRHMANASWVCRNRQRRALTRPLPN